MKPRKDSSDLEQRISRIREVVQAAHEDCGPSFVVRYTADWHDGANRLPRELEERIEAVIELLRREAVEHQAEPNWLLYIKIGERGTVMAAGCPWWPETPQSGQGAAVSFIARDDCWRSYAIE